MLLLLTLPVVRKQYDVNQRAGQSASVWKKSMSVTDPKKLRLLCLPCTSQQRHINRPQKLIEETSYLHQTHGTTVTAKDELESSNGLLLRHFFGLEERGYEGRVGKERKEILPSVDSVARQTTPPCSARIFYPFIFPIFSRPEAV